MKNRQKILKNRQNHPLQFVNDPKIHKVNRIIRIELIRCTNYLAGTPQHIKEARANIEQKIEEMRKATRNLAHATDQFQ